MVKEKLVTLTAQRRSIDSKYLKREVCIDFYLPPSSKTRLLSLLLINDGQNLPEMNFGLLLEKMILAGQIRTLICIGIHAGTDRKNEYGTAGILDYEGRGKKAMDYNLFILNELLPLVYSETGIDNFNDIGFAGFSLGGLSAIDMVWHHPEIFKIAGVFSGSLWWRSKSLEDDYNDDTDRIMQMQVREGTYIPGLRFYFTTGSLDETADRNNNGIIDSIDDTLAMIHELNVLGYQSSHDIKYINYQDGKHDIATWCRALPGFLIWGWGVDPDPGVL